MKLKELGEFGLIEKITSQFSKNLPAHIEGIGDDCAVIHQENRNSLLVTTDLLIENIHFLKKDISPFELGHKSLAVNISDIAAMGGKPLYAFLSIALPSHIEADWLKNYFEGFHKIAAEYTVLLLGGDTTKSLHDIVINVALVGEADPQKIKRRSQAKAGDYICVTDFLGDSGAGLDIILKNLERTSLEEQLIKRHYLPRPHIKEGQWLAQKNEVHAMMDVSDGIDSDLKRIMEQSFCGVEIYLESLPISRELGTFCHKYHLNTDSFATSAGEDYCLLFTLEAENHDAILKEYKEQFQKPFYEIGKIISQKTFSYLSNGQKTQIQRQGFDHFKQGNNHD